MANKKARSRARAKTTTTRDTRRDTRRKTDEQKAHVWVLFEEGLSQREIARHLVERVEYDGKAGTMSVTFRPSGTRPPKR